MNSIVKDKSFKFAIDIINLYRYLTENKKEFIMSKQLLRAGTSIGANISEALRGQSKKDFLAKIFISMKEADETIYWIELLTATGYINNTEILNSCIEISKILNAISKTTQNNLNLNQ